MDEAVDVKDIKIPKLILLPDSTFKKYWNAIIIILMLYAGTLLPYKLVFEDEDINTDIIDDIMFYIFIIDIFVMFFSAYYDKDHILVLSRYSIFKNYVQSWLILDIIASVPVNLFVEDPSESS